MSKKLPIDVDHFRELRENNYLYVDKTSIILEIVRTGLYYFFARPPKYGKSVLVSTLEELFKGSRELFQGLDIENEWDWSKCYPVVKISFNHLELNTPEEVDEEVCRQLAVYENDYNITYSGNPTAHYRLRYLLKVIEDKEKVGPVILVDDADKPMRDHFDNPKLAREMRLKLINIFNILKEGVDYVSFALLVGCFDFTTESIFVGFNGLLDVSYFKKYSNLCGFTLEEIEDVFSEHLKSMSITEIQQWYQGYSWEGMVEYNPYDIIHLLDKKEFRPYWYLANNPAKIVRWIIEHHYDLEYLHRSVGSAQTLRMLDLDYFESTFYLTRMGYLTIVEADTYDIGRNNLNFSYANLAVKRALKNDLFAEMVDNLEEAYVRQERLLKAMREHHFEQVKELVNEMFTSISKEWYDKYKINDNSYFYCNLFSLYFEVSGIDVSDVGYSFYYRSYKLVYFEEEYFLFHLMTREYALDHREELSAYEYLKNDPLVHRYLDTTKPLHLIGVDLSRDERRVVGFRSASM